MHSGRGKLAKILSAATLSIQRSCGRRGNGGTEEGRHGVVLHISNHCAGTGTV